MLHLDCSNGVSGDMIVGALIDLGADFRIIEKKLSDVADVRIKRVSKKGERAIKFEVNYEPGSRSYRNLVKEINDLKISKKSKMLSKKILNTLATAESNVHNEKLKDVHLHEAADSVIDAVATSLALENLNLIDNKAGSSIVSVGELAPATTYIIREAGIPIRIKSDKEITTPTGVAILKNIVCSYNDCGTKGKTGRGAGAMNLSYPNVLRAGIVNQIFMLETNIDDCTPEHVSFTMEKLMSSGAKDVSLLSCIMKKGRPGYLLQVMTDEPEKLSGLIMKETGTLGVRIKPIDRVEAERKIEKIKIRIRGKTEDVRVKSSTYRKKPEFEDVSRVAKKYNLTFMETKKLIEKILNKE